MENNRGQKSDRVCPAGQARAGCMGSSLKGVGISGGGSVSADPTGAKGLCGTISIRRFTWTPQRVAIGSEIRLW